MGHDGAASISDKNYKFSFQWVGYYGDSDRCCHHQQQHHLCIVVLLLLLIIIIVMS